MHAYMDAEDTKFLKSQKFKPLVWLRYNDDVFLKLTDVKENLNTFMKYFNNFQSNLNFVFECDQNSVNFFDLNGKLDNTELITSVYVKLVD